LAKELTAIATQAVDNAKRAEAIAKATARQRDEVTQQRDEYRAQRDLAKTQRDHLAGELASDQTKIKQLEFKKDELLVRSTLLKSDLNSAQKQRWWFLAAGAVAGFAIAGTGAFVLVSK
jgi:phage shock protein A